VIPELVDGGGFRVIAVEGPYAQWAAIDDYVRGGSGDPGALLRDDAYWFWNTQEVLDLILWARAQNANGITPPIRIAGVDATEPEAVATRVIAELRGIAPDLAWFAELQYGCLPQCNDAILEVRKRIAARFPNDDELIHAARVIEQGNTIGSELLGNRDAIMAENILWLADRGKVLLWGHNEHWSGTDYQLVGPRIYRSTGSDLDAALGDAYFVIGSIVRDGAFYNVQIAPRLRRRAND
jgi:erythromycin esterase